MPSFITALGLIMGVLSYYLALPFYLPVAVITALLILYRFRPRKFAWFAGALAIGVFLVQLPRLFAPMLGAGTIHGMVIDTGTNYYIVQSGLQRYYISEFNHQHEIFDFLALSGDIRHLEITVLESRFDFGHYLHNSGVRYEVVVQDATIMISSFFRPKALQATILTGLPDLTQDYLRLFIFGIRDYDSSVLQFSQALNLVYLFGLSGLYLALWNRILRYFLALKFGEMVVERIILLNNLCFAIFTFLNYTTLRYFLNSFIVRVNKHWLGGRLDALQRAGILYAFLLLLNPFLLASAAFYLPLGITVFRIITRHIFKRYRGPKKYLLSLLVMNALLLPYTLATNYSFTPLTLIVAPFLLILGVPTFFLSLLALTRLPLDWYFSFVDTLVQGSKSLGSMWPLQLYSPGFATGHLIAYFAVFIIFIFAWEIRARRFQVIGGCLVALVGATTFIPFERIAFAGRVSFINVGQGDATLIQVGQSNILIDTGGAYGFDISQEVLIPFFKKQKIYQIDYLIISHDDFDHSGGRATLIQQFKVHHVLERPDQFPLILGNFELENYNHYFDFAQDGNFNSLVLGFELNSLSYLLMGDAPVSIERQIKRDNPDLDIDVLKVGHHGSRTSSELEFIESVKPERAVISCGKDNRYGHPHAEVLSALKKSMVTIYRTDIEGTIVF